MPTAPLITDIEAGRSWHDSDILVFGEGSVSPYLNALESAAHDTTLEVDLDALVSNYNYYRHLVAPGTGIVAMVKASAYGTGAVEVAKTMQDAGAAYLAVAVIDEGIALRDAGVSMPVMVLNPITNRHRSLFTHRLEPAVFSLGELHTLRGEAAQTGVDDYQYISKSIPACTAWASSRAKSTFLPKYCPSNRNYVWHRYSPTLPQPTA